MNTLKKLTVVVMISVFMICAFPLSGFCDNYPSKPIKLIVTWGAGGSTDIIARKIASIAEKKLGQPIVVENKPGGSGSMGMGFVAKAKPDGYTLVVAPGSALRRTPHIINVSYDPLKDFTFIAKFLMYANGVMVPVEKPWKTFDELVSYAKDHPGELVYAVPGALEAGYIGMTYVANQEELKWKRVPYKGASDAMAAVLGGHADFFAGGGMGGNLKLVEAGKVRAVAIFSPERFPLLPDVPTLKELGYDHINTNGIGIAAPAGLPEEIQQTLETAFLEASNDPEFIDLANKMALPFIRMNGKEYKEDAIKGNLETGKMLELMGLKKN